MLRRRSPSTLRLALVGLLVSSTAVLGQTAPAPDAGAAPRPAPVESAPLPPPAATPAEPQPAPAPPPAAAQPAPPPGPATAQPAPGTRQTLVPTPGDPNDVDEVTLPARPAAIVSGRSTWDDGFSHLKTTFARIEAALKPMGITPTGRPITVFVETDDLGFRYDAIVPLDRPLEGPSPVNPEIRAGTTPSGKALRFVHESPYDDIDSTYETITAYLDAKGVTVKDTFIEEYVTDLTDPTDPNLRINIFVQPK
ncbi:GyrI-like domain-containing protein [Salinarimonas soli]|uniref:GyrI-like domain-containing protein n=1 Tax=Salinarimonas soli TaxID=1638099 RepID=A0A5B2V903_9HYPH|nr:GyrI-like domain-containing protein [Salinarimonas soli]KAA2234930.1 GyrI-like domain-containing protein [Salinarimonas soli]